MFTVTDDARAHLKTILEDNNVPDEQSVRLFLGSNGLGLTPDAENEQDTTFDHDGRTVLVVDQTLAEQLGERTMDIEQTEGGPQIKLT